MDQSANQTLTTRRVAVAAIIALLGSLGIWGLVPYNNFWLKNTYLADTFLPEIVIAFLLLLVLVVNPVLWLMRPAWVLDRRQVALVASLMLFAAVIPSNGLMRMFPRFVAQSNQGMNQNPTIARITAEAGFRQALFPDPLPERDAAGKIQTHETPVSDQFIDELVEGATIPWSAWILPMAAWGLLIFALWTMMIGLGGVVYPQWRDRERLPFPLLNVYHALIGDPDNQSKGLLPSVFRSRGFWIAAIVVFIIHASRGLSVFTGAFPEFPLSWNLEQYFTDSIFRQSTLALKRQSIFFALIGVAYFIPNRYAISVWGWVVAYALYMTLGRTFVPAFYEGQATDQSFGALLAIAAWVLWLGRAHWAQVGRAMFGRASGGPESRRDAIAGWMFAGGCLGIVCWLYWAGCSLWWSILAMLVCAIVTLLMARIIAETGIPFLWIGQLSVGNLSSLFPLSWQSPVIIYFTGVFHVLLTRASAMSAAVMTTLSLGMDKKASATNHSRLMVGGLVVLVIGFVICGAVHLDMGYRSADITTEAKTGADKISDWTRADRETFQFFTDKRWHQGGGAAVAGGLLWACSRFPGWPIHPVGIIFCQLSIGNLIWFSIFLGWLLKTAVTGLFGGGAYRKARPVFLGLIFGELLAVIVWTLVPVVIIGVTGADADQVPRYSLMQYP